MGDSTASMHLGKRSRPNATRNGEDQTSKRQKNNDLQPSYTRKLPVRNNLPNNDRKHSRADRAAGLSGASRTTSAVQPLSNGTIIAPHSRLTEGDSQTLNIDTSNSTQFKNNAGKDKRTLRSHDGASRSKTELAQYFPNFDDIMSDEPKEIELLTGETRLYVNEDPPKSPTAIQTFVLPSPLRRNSSNPFTPISSKPKTQIPTPFNCQELDFSDAQSKLRIDDNGADPLADSLYTKAHRRAERQEKQLRNIERERAMHEKVQLERLLEGLLGPDWLRVMGISGIVEGERKKWEDRRRYFVREVKSMLEKFRRWKEEERRRKADKEQSVKDEDEDEDEGDEDAVDEEEDEDEAEEADTSSLPNDDVDALAALQLHNESLSASSHSRKSRTKTKTTTARSTTTTPTSRLKKPSNPFNTTSKRPKTNPTSTPNALPSRTLKSATGTHLPVHDPTAKPITSFFAKPHQRAAALDKSRRSAGRTKLAFGVPLPDLPDRPFELPDGFVSQQALRASARGSRRLRFEKDKGGG